MNDTVNSLRDRITADMKDAMRAKATARLSTIRLLLAAIKQREVDERKTLSDADVVAVIDKMVKQRRDSITQFDAGNRADLADAERAELVILQSYLQAVGPSNCVQYKLIQEADHESGWVDKWPELLAIQPACAGPVQTIQVDAPMPEINYTAPERPEKP
jgi:uncharacterized protein YqeY